MRYEQYCQMSMLKRIFGGSELEALFDKCQVNKSHRLMAPRMILEFASKYLQPSKGSQSQKVNININITNVLNNQISININNTPQKQDTHSHKRKQLISLVLRKIRSSSDVQRIKGLVLSHAIIKRTFDAEFMQLIAEQVDHYIVEAEKEEKEEKTTHGGSVPKEFVHKNIISFYCQYLKRFILNVDTYKFAEDYLQSRLGKEEGGLIQTINQGFIILNLCNYILQSQYTFNKMGRYYIEHKEILNLFMLYISDMVVYNSFIKEVTRLSLRSVKEATPEEIKHHFLFVTESQKTSDRLYEFFYNRYYYTEVKKFILLPTFLNVLPEEYNRLVSYVKKHDPQLALIVKNSKFEGKNRSHSRTLLDHSEDISTILNRTDILPQQQQAFSFMHYVHEEFKDLEDIPEITVKKYTLPKR